VGLKSDNTREAGLVLGFSFVLKETMAPEESSLSDVGPTWVGGGGTWKAFFYPSNSVFIQFWETHEYLKFVIKYCTFQRDVLLCGLLLVKLLPVVSRTKRLLILTFC
jgi:hypothetical protein